MIQRILFVLGAIAWLFFTFLAGLYLTFPTTAAKERLEYEFGKAYKNEYALSVGDLSLWRFSGAALEDVTFYSVKRGRKSKDNPDPAHVRTPMLHLDALYARAAILPSLMGKKAVAFVAEIPGGALDGQYSESAESIELAFDASGIDLSKIPVSTEELSLNLLGSIQGEADLSFDTTDVKKSTGFLKLSFDGFGLGPNSGMGGFQLPEVTFSKRSEEHHV